ncbi:MFS transporter [Paenibacillus chibensis]|uniref:MFS transporter n=1 Tax=Paenibacillus chibensis TaxID=59846 RepID=UPI001FEB0F23|nr:MFS transporter [Paenibacillus chibensis]MEC0372950.1 MFS transporter [Paenibacillus chibensis]
MKTQSGRIAAISDSVKMPLPPYLVISILTIFAIGPQYFINLSYTMNQVIIQNGLNLSSSDLLLPSTLSNIAFALGVPLGPVISRKLGVRKTYLMFVSVFLLGALINLISQDTVSLTMGRIIQGLSSGFLFLTILPVSLKSFPNKIRNYFLLMVITGLFGASAVGAIFGSVSLSVDAWRWLFILNIVSAVLCLIVGFLGLPHSKEEKQESEPVNKFGIFLLTVLMLMLTVPLCNVMQEGFDSLYVWPFLVAAFILMILFIVFELKAKTPLVPFRTLKAAKPISGTVMAIASHVCLIFAMAGINGFLRNNLDLPYRYLVHFYIWFFVGILVTAVLKTLLYDRLGAGVLGLVGSIAVIGVSLQWRRMNPGISLNLLYFQIALLGAGVSMTLVGGALGTALAGDIHQASMRSVTLHSIRNFVGAVITPLLGWYLTRQNAVNYEEIRGRLGQHSAEAQSEIAGLIRKLMGEGVPAAQAQSTASYELIVNAKRAAVLGAYHHLFTIMACVGVIMLLASIGKIVTGKGRALVQQEKRLMMPKTGETELHPSPIHITK